VSGDDDRAQARAARADARSLGATRASTTTTVAPLSPRRNS
jgi:hypothetical protein